MWCIPAVTALVNHLLFVSAATNFLSANIYQSKYLSYAIYPSALSYLPTILSYSYISHLTLLHTAIFHHLHPQLFFITHYINKLNLCHHLITPSSHYESIHCLICSDDTLSMSPFMHLVPWGFFAPAHYHHFPMFFSRTSWRPMRFHHTSVFQHLAYCYPR